MAEITASLVKELREKTGAGMMDCKKALNEVAGDLEKAIDWLRTKGLSAAAKKAGRVAAEGLVGVAANGTRGAVVEVNAETDFVGRNEQFQKFVGQVARHRARQRRRPRQGRGRAVSRHRPRRAGRAHQPDRHDRREHDACAAPPRSRSRDGVVVGLHPQRGRAGPRQDRRAGGARSRPATRPSSRRSAKQLAMHVAAANPQSLTVADARPGRGRARARGAGREGRPVAARPPTSSPRWSRAACASSTRRSCCSSRPS